MRLLSGLVDVLVTDQDEVSAAGYLVRGGGHIAGRLDLSGTYETRHGARQRVDLVVVRSVGELLQLPKKFFEPWPSDEGDVAGLRLG